MNFNDFFKKAIFFDGSGIFSYLDSRLETNLNNYGFFSTKLKDNNELFSKTEDRISLVYPFYSQAINEGTISKNLFSNQPAIRHNNDLGYFLSLYVGHVLEGDFRKNGSSGGMGTWIFKELFEKKHIDYVIHVKKNTSNDGLLFNYQISSNFEEIKNGSKTKYYPVELSNILKIVKDRPGKYAIIGIPSFISSLRSLSFKDRILNERIRYFVGLICGHQKSTKYTEAIANEVGINIENLFTIDYRSKKHNNDASNYYYTLIEKQNDKIIKHEIPAKNFFSSNWGLGFFKYTSSDYSDDVFNETSDITLGDAWLEEYIQDDLGNNIVIVRNQVIDDLIKNAIKNKNLKMNLVDEQTVIKSQMAHLRHTKYELPYRNYLLSKKNILVPFNRVGISNDLGFFRKIVQKIRLKISSNSTKYFGEKKVKNNFIFFKFRMLPMMILYKIIYKVNSLIKVFIPFLHNKKK